MEKMTGKLINAKRILMMFTGIAVCLLLQHCTSSNAQLDNLLVQSASEFNKTCPVMVDR